MVDFWKHIVLNKFKFTDCNRAFDFKYDMASFLDFYSDKISLAGLGRLTGINHKQLSHYLTRKRNPSRKTVKRIEAALHEFGKEISQINFI